MENGFFWHPQNFNNIQWKDQPYRKNNTEKVGMHVVGTLS